MTGKFISICLGTLVIFIVIGSLLWAFNSYLELPMVKFSQSRQEVVAVIDNNGKELSKAPLPKKYEIIYVE